MRNRGPIFSVGQEGVGFCCFCTKRLASDRLDGVRFLRLRVRMHWPTCCPCAGYGAELSLLRVGGSLSFDVRQGLAGGQVVDGDFVPLPVGVGKEDVTADGHRIVRCRRKRHCCATGSRARGRGRRVPGWRGSKVADPLARRWVRLAPLG